MRLHGAGHLIEVAAAISENAYVTAMIALLFLILEIYGNSGPNRFSLK